MAAVVCSRSSHSPPAPARPSQPPRTPNPEPRPGPRGLRHRGARGCGLQLGGRAQTALPARRPSPSGSKGIQGPVSGVRGSGFLGPRVAARSHLPNGAAAHGLRGEKPARRPRSPGCLGPLGLGARAPGPHPSPPPKTREAPSLRTCPARRPPKLAPERGRGAGIHPSRGEARARLRAQGTP